MYQKKVLAAVGTIVLGLCGFYLLRKKKNQKRTQREERIYVGIELGGTNYKVVLANLLEKEDCTIREFKTLHKKSGNTFIQPDQALSEIKNFIRNNVRHQGISRLYFIGFASFGPVCLDKSNPVYGSITTTPKEKWRGKRLVREFRKSFGKDVQIGIDTDVNCSAYSEFYLGHRSVKQSLVYITVGTGVGVGIIAHGKTVHGLMHPEGGHISVRRSPKQYQDFQGVCPYHKDCLQGMVNNHAIAKRLNIDFTNLSEIEDNHPIWKLIGYYLAQLCLNVTLIMSPEKIIIGGGIMNRRILYGMVQENFIDLLAEYLQHNMFNSDVSEYIVPPGLGQDSGCFGAMLLGANPTHLHRKQPKIHVQQSQIRMQQ